MKTIIKLLITIAILNGLARVGLAVARYYEFKDAAEQLVTFGGDAQLGELQNQMLGKATALNLPVAYENIEVTRNGKVTTATASYTEDVEVFPSFKYPITFHFSVEGLQLGGLGGLPVHP
jgi:hypothetical protein